MRLHSVGEVRADYRGFLPLLVAVVLSRWPALKRLSLTTDSALSLGQMGIFRQGFAVSGHIPVHHRVSSFLGDCRTVAASDVTTQVTSYRSEVKVSLRALLQAVSGLSRALIAYRATKTRRGE